MEKTIADRAIEEPKRTAADDSWNVLSNYYFCPTLCRTCKYFYKEISNWPYHCKGPNSFAASHKSKKEGYKQYDDCICYEVKEESKNKFLTESKSSKSDDIDIRQQRLAERELMLKDREDEQEREEQELEEERKRKLQDAIFRRREYELTHCSYCGKEDNLIDCYEKKFHKPCWEEYSQSDEGKKWIAKAEKLKEEKRKKEEERIKKEAEEKRKEEEQEQQKKEFQAKKYLQRKVKMPILLIVTAITLSFNDTLILVLNKIQEKRFFPIITLCIIVVLYSGMLTALINSGYDTISAKIKNGYTVTKFSKFIVYAGLALIVTAIHSGIVFVVMHIFLKIW